MANNPYVNKVQLANGTTLIDISDTTAVASDVASGKYFYNAAGAKVQGTITQRDSDDLTASGATVSVPAGYYSAAASKAVAAGSATTPATTITANPSISVNASGLITASVSGSQSVTPTVSAGYVSSGTAGTVSVSGSNTEQLSTQGATTITPTTSSQTAVAAGKYTTGAVTVGAIPSEYIIPAGSLEITENGEGIDVSQYAEVDVAVPGQIPTGVKYIYTDVDGRGAWDVSGYQYCSVDYAPVKDGLIRLWVEVTEDDLEVSVYAYYSTSTNCSVNWGDGNIEDFTGYRGTTKVHTYESPGRYVIELDNGPLISNYLMTKGSNTTPDNKLLGAEIPYGVNTNNKANVFYKCVNLKTVSFCGEFTSLGTGFFYGCSSLKKIDLPDSLTSIENNAFRGCTSLEHLDFPSGIVTLPSNLCNGCTSLVSVNIPQGVTSVDTLAFANCSSLNDVILPSSVTTINNAAFQLVGTRTNKATFTILATTPPTLGTSVFSIAQLNKIYVPATSLEAYKTATNWSAFASKMEAIA